MKNLHSRSWRVEFQIVTYRPVICNLAYLCRTAISFSMLFSLPSKAFFGIHLMATNLWVLFSSARTTSENAPLKHKHRGQSGRPSVFRCLEEASHTPAGLLW